MAHLWTTNLQTALPHTLARHALSLCLYAVLPMYFFAGMQWFLSVMLLAWNFASRISLNLTTGQTYFRNFTFALKTSAQIGLQVSFMSFWSCKTWVNHGWKLFQFRRMQFEDLEPLDAPLMWKQLVTYTAAISDCAYRLHSRGQGAKGIISPDLKFTCSIFKVQCVCIKNSCTKKPCQCCCLSHKENVFLRPIILHKESMQTIQLTCDNNCSKEFWGHI